MIVFFYIKMRYTIRVENIFLPSSSTPVANPFPLVIVATGVCYINLYVYFNENTLYGICKKNEGKFTQNLLTPVFALAIMTKCA